MKKCLIFLRWYLYIKYSSALDLIFLSWAPLNISRASPYLSATSHHLPGKTLTLLLRSLWEKTTSSSRSAENLLKIFYHRHRLVLPYFDCILICTASVWTGCWQPIFGLWSSNDGLNQLFYFQKNIQTSRSEKKNCHNILNFDIYLRTFKVILCLSPSFPCTQFTLPLYFMGSALLLHSTSSKWCGWVPQLEKLHLF